MSVGAKISIESDTASPWLRDLAGRVTPQRIAAEVGPRCTRLVQRNFRSLGTNAKGWPTTNFYAGAARATSWETSLGFVTISVNQIGIRQRLMGGDIKPVHAKALTIPAAPEAYGKTAGEFDNLEFGMLVDPASGHLRPCLKEARATRIKIGKQKKDGGRNITPISTTTGQVAIFWLSQGVHQEPDPRVMPTDEQFQTEFDKSVETLLKRPVIPD